MRVASLRESQISSSKQTRTCSKRLQMKHYWKLHTVLSMTQCPKAIYLKRTLLSRGFFPPFVGKITCYVNFDNLIGQFLCLPQYHHLRRRSAKLYLWDTESEEDQATLSLLPRGDRPSMPPTDYQEEKGAFQLTKIKILWSTHYNICRRQYF